MQRNPIKNALLSSACRRPSASLVQRLNNQANTSLSPCTAAKRAFSQHFWRERSILTSNSTCSANQTSPSWSTRRFSTSDRVRLLSEQRAVASSGSHLSSGGIIGTFGIQRTRNELCRRGFQTSSGKRTDRFYALFDENLAEIDANPIFFELLVRQHGTIKRPAPGTGYDVFPIPISYPRSPSMTLEPLS
jgi:hypothetical protein